MLRTRWLAAALAVAALAVTVPAGPGHAQTVPTAKRKTPDPAPADVDPDKADALGKASADQAKEIAALRKTVTDLSAQTAAANKSVADMKVAADASVAKAADAKAAEGKAADAAKAALDQITATVNDTKAALESSKKTFDDSLKGVADIKTTADAAKAAAPAAGDTAWMLISSALVMFMLPGLALFYGGMVRRKNILATMMQSVACLAVVGLFWVAFGYGLAFGPSRVSVDFTIPLLDYKIEGGLIGWSWDLFFLQGIETSTVLPGYNIPVYVHCMFQGMFAIITPALISGAVAERIRFWPFCIFCILWVAFVYCPLAHMVWAYDWFYAAPTVADKAIGASAVGVLGKLVALDFAGGTVVHISAGFAGLAACLVLKKRDGHPKTVIHPNSMVITLLGAGMLWFGWFGFNGGSATGSNALAGSAFAATQAAAAAAGLGWILVEWLLKGKPTALGLASGIVAGLVAVTPASGYVYIWGGAAVGLIAGVACYFAVALKNALGYDDSLDAFGVHGVGGFIGAVLTGLFCYASVNSAGGDGYFAVKGMPAKVAALEAKAAAADAAGKPDDAKAARDEATKVKDTIETYGKDDSRRTPFTQLKIQLVAAAGSAVFAFVLSLALVALTQAITLGNFTTDRPSETEGLDRTEHGEVGFDFGYATQTMSAASEPRAADAPKSGQARFELAVEGVPADDIATLWTGLCQPGDRPPSADFVAVYPHVTTFTGNKFQCRGADAPATAARLESLFKKLLPGRAVKVVRL